MKEIIETAKQIEQAGGRLFFVGGKIRDDILGIPCKDWDFCVVGLDIDELFSITGVLPNIHPNANAPVFGWFADGEVHELAIARREISTGAGKDDFIFVIAQTIEEDLIRRDVTINALAEDVLTGEIIDPFGGAQDIRDGILRHVSEAFAESPERVFRVVVKFQSRFGFDIAPETVEIMREMVSDWSWGLVGKNADTLAIVNSEGESVVSSDQIWKQGFKDFFAKGIHFVKVFNSMIEVGLDHLFPEIFDMAEIPENFKHHGNQNTLEHTVMVMQAADVVSAD